jgi:hypothetical protein
LRATQPLRGRARHARFGSHAIKVSIACRIDNTCIRSVDVDGDGYALGHQVAIAIGLAALTLHVAAAARQKPQGEAQHLAAAKRCAHSVFGNGGDGEGAVGATTLACGHGPQLKASVLLMP